MDYTNVFFIILNSFTHDVKMHLLDIFATYITFACPVLNVEIIVIQNIFDPSDLWI